MLSIKKEFDCSESELESTLKTLQKGSKSIALRFTEEYLQLCKQSIETLLREEDFILFDIGEQGPETKFIEIEELMKLHTKAKCILLNSPRKRDISNAEYPEMDFTDMINDSARQIAEVNEMHGYGN